MTIKLDFTCLFELALELEEKGRLVSVEIGTAVVVLSERREDG